MTLHRCSPEPLANGYGHAPLDPNGTGLKFIVKKKKQNNVAF